MLDGRCCSICRQRLLELQRDCTVYLLKTVPILVLAALLSGCISTLGGVVLGKTLELVGLDLKKPEIPSQAQQLMQQVAPRKISFRLHAGDTLNTDTQRRSLSTVVRVYKLRTANAFLAAPYKSLGSEASEKAAFGGDLLDVREVVLTPGQKHEVLETMPAEASYLAVAALFRAPAPDRWRFVFSAQDSEKSGITVGVHGCALSVAAGVPEGAVPETLRLAGVNCY